MDQSERDRRRDLAASAVRSWDGDDVEVLLELIRVAMRKPVPIQEVPERRAGAHARGSF